MKVLSVLLVIAAMSASTNAWYGGWGYYYPYSFGYYPYSGWYGGLYGIYGKRGDTKEGTTKTECLYIKNDHTFKCKGPLGEVECDAEFKLDESVKLEMFGIGKPDDFDTATFFKLFPRKLDNSGWTNNVIEIKGEEFNVSIHQKDSLDMGLMVKEAKCFKKISDLLKDSKRDELISIKDMDKTERIVGDFSVVVRAKRSIGKYDDEGKEIEERDDQMNMMLEKDGMVVKRYGGNRYQGHSGNRHHGNGGNRYHGHGHGGRNY